MQWKVEGADAETGADRAIDVEADNEDQATAFARLGGILASSVTRVPGSGNHADHLAMIATQALPVSYATPRRIVTVPDYTGLKLASSMLMILAILAYVLGGLMIVIAVLAIIGGAATRSGAGLIGGLFSFVSSASPIIAGAIMHGMAASCTALRDIARNSFRA
jgi:hypothetical protein